MDPYRNNLVPKNIYYKKIDIASKVVAVLDDGLQNRRLAIIPEETRTFKKYDVVELIATVEKMTDNREVNHIKYLAFIEIKDSGVIKRGDLVLIGSNAIGNVLGFDASHYPNHYNLVLSANTFMSGKELGICLQDEITFSYDTYGGVKDEN